MQAMEPALVETQEDWCWHGAAHEMRMIGATPTFEQPLNGKPLAWATLMTVALLTAADFLSGYD